MKDLDEVTARLEAFADNENVPDTVKGEFLNIALQMTELLSTAVRLTSVNSMLNKELAAAQQRAEHAEREATAIRQREVSLLMQWQEKVDAAQQRVTGLVDRVKQLEAEVAELRAIKFRRFNNEDCWIYQGDGEDHLESLVCPVVMSAQQVMEFEKAQQRVAELEKLCTMDGIEDLIETRERLTAENACLREQVAELERELNQRKVEQIKKPTVTDVLSVCEDLTAENAELRRLTDRHDRDYAEVHKQVDRLRELLLVCKNRLHMFPQLCKEINAELAKGSRCTG